jgi:hypothetical protein
VEGDADSELEVVYRILERRYLVEGMSGLHPKEETRPTQQRRASSQSAHCHFLDGGECRSAYWSYCEERGVTFCRQYTIITGR